MVRLPDILLKHRDDVLRGRNNDVPSVRQVSDQSQMKHSTTSQWYVTKTFHWYVSTTFYYYVSTIRCLQEVPNEKPNNVAAVRHHHVNFTSCFRVSVVHFEYELLRWVRFFNYSKNSNGYSIPSPANKYMFKVSKKTLKNNRR